jgi:Ca-activated chloride channel family protein
MRIQVTILLITISCYSFGQLPEVEKAIQAGNDFYKQQQYDQAAAEYKKALTKAPGSTKAKFNLANTTAKQGKPDEAVKSFTEISDNAKEVDLKSKAFYNKGAVLSQQKKLEESIDCYKNALRQNPDDKEARENLQKALLELKKKNPPKPKKENQKKNPQKQPPSKMNRKEAEQRLKLLEQKEKEVQQRLQKEKSKAGGSQTKDW